MRSESARSSSLGRAGSPEPLVALGHWRQSSCQQEGPLSGRGKRVGGQVGPGERRDDSFAVGQLQNEPRGILPPKVVHHGGELAADSSAVILKNTNSTAADVE
jgi:hypothetical protein